MRGSVLAALPAAAKPAAQADVAEDDADRGALAAQPEAAASLSRLAVRRHDPRWEPGALAAHAGICAGGGEQSPSLPRRRVFNDLRTTQIAVDVDWKIRGDFGGLRRQVGRGAACETHCVWSRRDGGATISFLQLRHRPRC